MQHYRQVQSIISGRLLRTGAGYTVGTSVRSAEPWTGPQETRRGLDSQIDSTPERCAYMDAPNIGYTWAGSDAGILWDDGLGLEDRQRLGNQRKWLRVAIAETTWHSVRVRTWRVGYDSVHGCALPTVATYWLLKGLFFSLVKSSNSKFVPHMHDAKCNRVSVCQTPSANISDFIGYEQFHLHVKAIDFSELYVISTFPYEQTYRVAGVTGYRSRRLNIRSDEHPQPYRRPCHHHHYPSPPSHEHLPWSAWPEEASSPSHHSR